MTYTKNTCQCNEGAPCFAQIGGGAKPYCKILNTPYPEGKCPFYKRNASDKPRIVKKEAATSD